MGNMRRVIVKTILLSVLFLFLSCSFSSSGKFYTIARDPTWFPLFLFGKQDNVFAFSDDLMMSVMSIEKKELDLVVGNWDNLLYNLWKGYYSAVLTSISPTEANKELYDFSSEFLSVGDVLVVRENDTVKSLADLEGKIVAINKRGESVMALERFPSIVIRTYGQASEALQELEQGKVDGVVIGILPAFTITTNLYKGVLKVSTIPLDNRGLRLITLKGHYPELIKVFNRGLKKMKGNGSYELLVRKWGLYQ